MRLESGTQLGHYKILTTLGKGGMGEVYRARDLRLGREVAIKVLPEALAEDPDLLKRFEKEAKALATLAHSNILTIFDFGNDNGIAYTVTEVLEGESLRSKISDSQLSRKQVVEISGSVAEGMAAAHSKEIIHRDLKPENIFLCSDGRIKILDFGLVHWNPEVTVEELSAASTQIPETDVTRLMGTVPYMSPEQLKGSRVDSRSDIFSFGCILYEMLTGTHPFLHKTFMETVAAILKDEPRKPTPEIDTPAQLEKILFRCLNKNPEERYHSAKDLAYDLASLRNEFATSARIPSQPVPFVKKLFGWQQIIAVFAILIVIGAAIWWRQSKYRSPKKVDQSIAVLPFSNMNANKEDEYFSDGITEDIITHLSKVGDLKVVSRTSSMRYKNSNKSIQQIGGELKVASVLEGSVRRQGDKLRIVAQLIDAQSDNHIWAETYDREMKDVFTIQSDVAKKIAAALQAKLLPEEKRKIEQVPTQNITAYDYYLKGREYFTRYQSQHNETAIDLYQKATEVDPNFALAYVGLCDGYSMRKTYNAPGASFEAAIDQCNKALSINRNLAEVHATLYKAYMLYGFPEKGTEALKKAYEIDPNNSMVVGRMASDDLNMGKLEEAFQFSKRALELDPTNSFNYFTMGVTYYALADFAHAEAFLKKSIDLQPDLGFSTHYLTRVYLAQGKIEQAREQTNKTRSVHPDSFYRNSSFIESILENYPKAIEYGEKSPNADKVRISYALLKMGRRVEAEKMLEEAERINSDHLKTRNMEAKSERAMIFAIRGNKQGALKQLKNACDQGYSYYSLTERDPIFENIRNDPQFRQIIESMKLKVTETRRRLGI